jgi:hypothetical protein
MSKMNDGANGVFTGLLAAVVVVFAFVLALSLLKI